MDVGTGSGVLSLFAVKEAGMKQAIAVDASAIAVAAGRLVKECRLEERITVHRGRIEDMHELPGRIKEVDVIVSEWMGYALFNESVLDSIITARQRFLKDGGFMLPDGTRLRMLGSTCSRERPMDEHGTEIIFLFHKQYSSRNFVFFIYSRLYSYLFVLYSVFYFFYDLLISVIFFYFFPINIHIRICFVFESDSEIFFFQFFSYHSGEFFFKNWTSGSIFCSSRRWLFCRQQPRSAESNIDQWRGLESMWAIDQSID